MKAIVEIGYIAPRFSKTCSANIPGGYEANCLNPEDFGCSQVYSQRCETKAQAYADIRDQLRNLGATHVETSVLLEEL